MIDDTQQVTETSTNLGNTVQKTTEVSSPQDVAGHQQNVAVKIIWYIAGLLLVLLAFRFIFSLLGANTTNGLANFVYTASYPFVAPFFSLFSYDGYSYGVSHFEMYTLLAMLFYALIAWGITKLITLNRD